MSVVRSLLVLSGASLLFFACGKPTNDSSQVLEAWNSVNNPLRLGQSYQLNFSKLPTSGRAQNTPWSDTYWPSNKGGIAQRWNSSNPLNFGYGLYDASSVRRLTPEQIGVLSPAEKYDIYMGRYDYPTVANEWRRTSPAAAPWEGLCHGWAPASLLYAEPRPVTLTGANGVRVKFGAADVKALLAYAHSVQSRGGSTRGVAARCNVRSGNGSAVNSRPECRDVNAGAFHAVLANQLGLKKQGFLADVVRDYEVWNHPIYAYSTRVRGYQRPSMGAAPGTVQEAVVDTTITYAGGTNPAWGPGARADKSKTYTYRLELNARNEIIGGEWLTFDRPDFLWTMGRSESQGYYENIFKIYRSSVGESDEANALRSVPESPVDGLPDHPDVSAEAREEVR